MREMELHDQRTRTLCRLGLTPLQAKTYLTLIRSGKEKIQIISRIAEVDRANTYQTLDQLQKIGLVEKTLGTPNLYQAIPLHLGLSTLLERKKDEYNEIQEDAQQLITASQADGQTPEEKEYEFKLVRKGKTASKKEIIEHCRIAQTSIDFLINLKSFNQGVIALSKYYLEGVRRGVKNRVIIGEPNFAAVQECTKRFLKVPNFQIKYIPNEPEPGFVIVDRKDIHISLMENRGVGEREELTLTHPGCIAIFGNYFETVWNQAQLLEK